MMKKILLNYKTWIAVIVVCGLGYVFLPLANEVLGIKTLQVMTGKPHKLKDIYRPYIEKITFVSGHFILFVRKPRLFVPGVEYIYISDDGKEWKLVERADNGGPTRGGWNGTHDIPFEFNGKCYIYSGYLAAKFSSNCQGTWTYFDFKWPEKMWNIKMQRSSNEYTQPLIYNDKLIFVFKETKEFFTSQLVSGYEILYATNDGVNWYQLKSSESVVSEIVRENNLKKSKLSKDVKYSGDTPPDAYDLPQYPQNNIKAYNQLLKISQVNNLARSFDQQGLGLREELSASGNNTSIGIFTIKDENDYHIILSKDGKSYQIIPMPKNVTGFLADFLF